MLSLPTKIKVKSNPLLFFMSCLIVIVLLLFSLVNIETYTAKPKVLGVETEPLEKNYEVTFWEDFLKQNPTYFEGWLELYNLTGRESYLEKAKEINPNYF